ncbi:MAG TPA: hypothetical protein VM432_07530 [Bdellovibrionales bacterium]|nr:hypothetical protein [Bdellovibrionales bacterium]
MTSFSRLFAAALLLSAVSAQAGQNWTVKPDQSDAIQAARERMSAINWEERDEDAEAQIAEHVLQSGESLLSIEPLDTFRIEGERNDPSINAAIRLGVEEDDVTRFYLLGIRKSSITNPDFSKHAALVKVTFSFGAGESLKLKKISPRIYFEKKQD